MRFPFDQDRLEPAHADGEIGLGRFDEQMIMIGHQAVGVADPTVTTDDSGESGQKHLAVSVSEKNFLARVAAAGQMIYGTWKLQAKGSRHDAPCLSESM